MRTYNNRDDFYSHGLHEWGRLRDLVMTSPEGMHVIPLDFITPGPDFFEAKIKFLDNGIVITFWIGILFYAMVVLFWSSLRFMCVSE